MSMSEMSFLISSFFGSKPRALMATCRRTMLPWQHHSWPTQAHTQQKSSTPLVLWRQFCLCHLHQTSRKPHGFPVSVPLSVRTWDLVDTHKKESTLSAIHRAGTQSYCDAPHQPPFFLAAAFLYSPAFACGGEEFKEMKHGTACGELKKLAWHTHHPAPAYHLSRLQQILTHTRVLVRVSWNISCSSEIDKTLSFGDRVTVHSTHTPTTRYGYVHCTVSPY